MDLPKIPSDGIISNIGLGALSRQQKTEQASKADPKQLQGTMRQAFSPTQPGRHAARTSEPSKKMPLFPKHDQIPEESKSTPTQAGRHPARTSEPSNKRPLFPTSIPEESEPPTQVRQHSARTNEPPKKMPLSSASKGQIPQKPKIAKQVPRGTRKVSSPTELSTIKEEPELETESTKPDSSLGNMDDFAAKSPSKTRVLGDNVNESKVPSNALEKAVTSTLRFLKLLR
jgi:hypothetical protein